MSNLCYCDGQIAKTGKSLNDQLFGTAVMSIVVPLYGSDGTPNTIDPTGDVQAQLLAGFTAQDPADRFNPILIQDYAPEDEGTQFEADTNGQNNKIRESIKTIGFASKNVSYTYMGQLYDRCTEYGEYKVDICGNILGSARSATDFRPIQINENSMSVIPTDKTDGQVQKAMVSYQYRTYESNNWDKWAVLTDSGANEAVGMLDAVVTATIDSATQATLDIAEIYGSAQLANPITGLVLADVTLTNYTTDTTGIALTSLTPSATVPGRYTAVFAAQTTADKISFVVYKAAASIDVRSYLGESEQKDAL